MKIQTEDLIGEALNWAVSAAQGDSDVHPYSTNWSDAGPIIEREGIRLHRSHSGDWWAGPESNPHRPVSGTTPLIAAMRCYVASQLGDEIEVPEELK